MDYLIDPSFQGLNKLFLLSFEDPVKTKMRIYSDIQKITAGQGDDYTTGCLIYYLRIKE